MKFNVFFKLKGPVATTDWVPITSNPVEAENLRYVLKLLEDKLPRNEQLQLEAIGLKIDPIME